MTISERQVAVESGRCSWIQVHETLINAGTTHHTRRLFLDADITPGPGAHGMLAQLVQNGTVPLSPACLAAVA